MSEEHAIPPTPERAQHDPVDALDQTIADDLGNISRPWRVRDILMSLEVRGAITAEMRQAGEDFRLHFRNAQLDGLRAADVSRPIVSGGRHQDHRLENRMARRFLDDARVLLGGNVSPMWSIMQDVIGRELPIRKWCEGRPYRPEEATGILIAALSRIGPDDV